MSNKRKLNIIGIALASLFFSACAVPYLGRKTEIKTVPESYTNSKDTLNTAKKTWKDFFKDPNLSALIDSALTKNQELNIILQEVNISKNEIRAKKGEYLPSLNIGVGGGIDKSARYTRNGAVDATTDIMPGKAFPDPLPDLMLAAHVTWEVDIWKKLRNAKKSAVFRYLSTIEGKNFMVTHLISEIANSYYELLALDNQLNILRQNIQIQQNALEIVKLEKISAKVTELAVRKFEAEVLKNQSRQFYILQKITETENRINFLVGRFPQPVARNSENFTNLVPDSIHTGIPTQLLENRPDIRQAEKQLAASKIDVKVAKANFYPSLNIIGGIGAQAFNPQFLFTLPESMLFYLAGELVAPLVNRNGIKAKYYSANSRQIQAVYNYERTVLNAYIEVANQISNIKNLQQSFDLKTKQVEALTQSIEISTGLFKSARADYMEVLMTQRDALDSRFELVETKMQQMHAMVNVYAALGGGWK
ncbi:TolC family protein [Aurantibacillus circumpalustris]|uniref:TolC family protein n=1 Tax=Aurantibacillus circumpalustris TaxID=3036359 RepID=UPI00295A830C|nr:efflux transporter outer membrane subunit [Aurantibacillus circumpalustris]